MNIQSLIALLLITLLYSCNSQKAVVSKETSLKREISRDYPLFFNAENARVMGDTKKALALYTEFVKKFPNNATANYNLSRLQLQEMNISEAEKNAARAFKLDPANKYFQEYYAQVLVISNKTRLAEEQYEDLVRKYPREEEYLYEKAILQMLMKEYDKSILTFNALEKSMGFNEDIIQQKKNIYLKQGKTDSAVAEINKLKKEDISTAKYDVIIADIYETAGLKEKVADIYKGIEMDYPNDPTAQIALSQYYLEKKNNERYNHFMQLVMQNRNLDVETKIALVIPALRKLETDTLQRDEIVRMAKSISEESGNNKEAISLYADVLYFSRKYDDALIEYKRYLTLDTKKFSIWTQVISIYSEKQELDSVIHISKQCIEVFPSRSIPYFYVGVTYLRKKELNPGVEYLNKGLPLERENQLLQSQYYSSLGDAYNSLKKFALSDSCFEKAIQLQPADATALNNYAYYLSLRKERLEDAARMSKKSLELQPGSTSFLDTYGWIFYQQGNYKEALIYIQKAIDADGQSDGTLYEHLGDVYFKLDDTKKALESWQKSVEKGENNPTLLKKIKDGILYE